ncbi:MAG: flippase-like domain-containing protein [Deltaproteobacteria bacterium]|nr:flippase-like domain-containing protein [Deltaproteobacteria bacterium]
MKAQITKWLNIGFLLLGLVLFVVFLIKMDHREVLAQVRRVGFNFVGAFSCYVLGLWVTTHAWKAILDSTRSRASFLDLFLAFWVGHAVNEVTPTGSMGEVLKGTMLRDKVESDELIASIVVFNFLSTFSMQVFVLLGPLLSLCLLDLPADIVWLLFGIAVLFFIPISGLFFLLRRGAAGLLVKLLLKLPFVRTKDPEAWAAKAKAIDDKVRGFYRNRPRDFWRSIFFYACARLLQAAELWFILLALLPEKNPGWLFLVAVLIQTASQLLSWAMTFVPGQLGVAEGGMAMLFRLLGLSSLLGFSMEVVRRARRVLGILIGLVIGWSLGISLRPMKARCL